MSNFSHTAVALSSEQLIESYDWAGTPCEEDGGVTRLGVALYSERGSLMNLAVLRPRGLDYEMFARVADHAAQHSPPFPSTTGVLLAFAGLGDHPHVRIPGARGYVEKRLHLLGDGAARVTCAEFAARLFLEAGVELNFQSLRLLSYIELLRGADAERLQETRTRRQLDIVSESSAEPTGLSAFVAGFPRAVSASSRERSSPDWVDLLMPGDFLRCTSLDAIATCTVEK